MNITKHQLGLNMIEHGQLSEYHQKIGDTYMYDYHHAKYLELKKQYNNLKPISEK